MLKALVIDDEKPARCELIYLLEAAGGVEVIAEASSVRSAIEVLELSPCDVVFLDIEMPEATGMQLAKALLSIKNAPAVVFTTAYSEYAFDAFNVNALDYLVKPIEEDRLALTLERVRERAQPCAQKQKTSFIPIDRNGKRELVRVDEIRFIVAKDDYSCLYTDVAHYFLTTSLGTIEKRLEGCGFFRAHRSYLVNLSKVDEYETVKGGTLLLTLNGIKEGIPVARRRVPALRKALGI